MCTEKEIDKLLEAAEKKGWNEAIDRVSQGIEFFQDPKLKEILRDFYKIIRDENR